MLMSQMNAFSFSHGTLYQCCLVSLVISYVEILIIILSSSRVKMGSRTSQVNMILITLILSSNLVVGRVQLLPNKTHSIVSGYPILANQSEYRILLNEIFKKPKNKISKICQMWPNSDLKPIKFWP